VVPDCADLIAVRDARHAYAVLQGLTSGSGAMVAAATTSLPERLEGGRNYDYRYAWIRDQCYAGLAVAAHGPHPLLEGTVRFLTGRILDDGPGLMPAYTVSGGRIPDERNLRLRGYPGGAARAGEPGHRPVPARRARGDPGTAGRRRAAGPAGRGELAGRGRSGRRDRPALGRARRRALGTGRPVLGAFPAHLRVRAALAGRRGGRAARRARAPAGRRVERAG